MKPAGAKFERLIALALAALGLMIIGGALDIVYRLVRAGWHAADFLINLFFSNP